MKCIIVKGAALLLIVWYSMSIIGFGIHTCSGSGRSFVVTFIEGLSCEDVHPEHQCHQGACCAHLHTVSSEDEEDCLRAKSCCSSDYQVLTLTGTLSDDKNTFDPAGCSAENYGLGCALSDNMPSLYSRAIPPCRDYLPQCLLSRNIQVALSVWRI